MTNKQRHTRNVTRRLTRQRRKSNWGGWIRTTDLLINSRCPSPSVIDGITSVDDEIASVDDTGHTKRHTVQHPSNSSKPKPLALGILTPRAR